MVREILQPIDRITAQQFLEAKHPLEMGILRMLGTLPSAEFYRYENPFTHEPETEDFTNIGGHMISVAKSSGVLGRAIFGEESFQANLIEAGALLHDMGKPAEIMARKAWKRGMLTEPYSLSAYEECYARIIRPTLERQGVAPDIIVDMKIAGAETGHVSFAHFVRLTSGRPTLVTDDVGQEIVHLADDRTHSPLPGSGERDTLFVDVKTRMQLSKFLERYHFLYFQGFGFQKDGGVVFVDFMNQYPEFKKLIAPEDRNEWFGKLKRKDSSLAKFEDWQSWSTKGIVTVNPDLVDVKTYAQWQVWIDRQISAHLVALMGVKGVRNPQRYITRFVNEVLRREAEVLGNCP
ncbi:hypothetical protein M1555_05500 [Patescibacteria group bacterium]|nr:hypothetical protein [Patescibacteria group bacterium]